jgi:putative transposase
MNSVLHPWQLFFAILAGWVNSRQQVVIDYLRTENQVLKEKLGKKRILLSDDQRRRLAVRGKVLGRKALEQIATLVTPDTILRWHRQLIAEKWDYSNRRERQPGRPPTTPEVVELVVRLARENPTWGYDRSRAPSRTWATRLPTANILKHHDIEPAPERRLRTSWRTFIKAHWDVLASIDFTTVEVSTLGGLVTYWWAMPR